jgi:hypothetical protein
MIVKDKERGQLLEVWSQLGKGERQTLLQFGQFLQSQQAQSQEPVSQLPLNLTKPDNESAVKALKRLKRSYPMIDADMGLLDEASRLLMERVTGTPDPEVIEKMEVLFADRFQIWQKEKAATEKPV